MSSANNYTVCTPWLGIRSFTHHSFAHFLIMLKSNERLYCKRFAQITQDKWATVIEWLRSHKTNEQPRVNRSGRSWQMSKWANQTFAHYSLIFSQKSGNSLRKTMSEFLTLDFLHWNWFLDFLNIFVQQCVWFCLSLTQMCLILFIPNTNVFDSFFP